MKSILLDIIIIGKLSSEVKKIMLLKNSVVKISEWKNESAFGTSFIMKSNLTK